eukprot:1157497-Pelagomonas_calceolata.AAC.3
MGVVCKHLALKCMSFIYHEGLQPCDVQLEGSNPQWLYCSLSGASQRWPQQEELRLLDLHSVLDSPCLTAGSYTCTYSVASQCRGQGQ